MYVVIDVRASQCNAYIIVIQVLCVSYQRNNIFTFSFSNNWTKYSAMWCALWLITVVKYPIDSILLQVSCVRCCSMASSSALFTAGHDVHCGSFITIANYTRFNSSSSVMCQVPQERFIDAVCFHICKPQNMCQIQVSCVRGHMKRLASSSVSLTTGHDETSSHALS